MIALGIMTTIMDSDAILLPLFSSLAVAIIIGFNLTLAGIAQVIVASPPPPPQAPTNPLQISTHSGDDPRWPKDTSHVFGRRY